jgi:hypothetical protein
MASGLSCRLLPPPACAVAPLGAPSAQALRAPGLRPANVRPAGAACSARMPRVVALPPSPRHRLRGARALRSRAPRRRPPIHSPAGTRCAPTASLAPQPAPCSPRWRLAAGWGRDCGGFRLPWAPVASLPAAGCACPRARKLTAARRPLGATRFCAVNIPQNGPIGLHAGLSLRLPAASQGGRRGRRHCDGVRFAYVRRRVPPRRPVGSAAIACAFAPRSGRDGPSSDPGPCSASLRGLAALRLRTAGVGGVSASLHLRRAPQTARRWRAVFAPPRPARDPTAQGRPASLRGRSRAPPARPVPSAWRVAE